MKTILSLGSINADFMFRVAKSPDGAGTLLGHDLLRTSGGKAANVAFLARRLGAPARLLACVGDDDLARQALRGLRSAGVELDGVRTVPGPTGMATILVPPGGDKTIVLALNANAAWESSVDDVVGAVDAAGEGSVFVADLEVPFALVEAGVRAARRRGLTVIVDPAPADAMTDALFAMVDHLTPDHREAETLSGIDTTSSAGAAHAAEALRDKGAGTVYVKLSAGGCAVASADGCDVLTAPDVDVVDVTGAGDAFAGALAWALLSGRAPRATAIAAVAASACAVGRYGSQESYPDVDTLDAMVVRVEAANR